LRAACPVGATWKRIATFRQASLVRARTGQSVRKVAKRPEQTRQYGFGELWSLVAQSPVCAKALRHGHVVVSASHVGGQGKRRSDKEQSWVLPSETLL
jgi:hypothetical protein